MWNVDFVLRKSKLRGKDRFQRATTFSGPQKRKLLNLISQPKSWSGAVSWHAWWVETISYNILENGKDSLHFLFELL